MLAGLKKPDGGGVYAFMDERRNVYGRWDAANRWNGRRPHCRARHPAHIDENLRNTKRIAQTFRGFAGEHFSPRAGDALPVRLVACLTEDVLDLASDCVDALIDEGWAANQIALLTTNMRHPIHQDYFETQRISEYWTSFHDDAEFYEHVLGFKGLERSVVILCVNGFKDMARAPEQLYVGLSRARCLLVVVGDPELIAKAGGRELELALGRAEGWRPSTYDATP